MNFRLLTCIACAWIALLPTAEVTEAQSTADSVRVQVEAALALLHEGDRPRTIWLNPRPDLRTGVLDSLTFKALSESGFRVYEEPGIPGIGVGLLSSGTFRSSERGSELVMRITYFGSRDIRLNTYFYRFIFPLRCDDEGCVLGEQLESVHGDGHTSGDCWDDFFIRSAEERKECYGR